MFELSIELHIRSIDLPVGDAKTFCEVKIYTIGNLEEVYFHEDCLFRPASLNHLIQK